MLHKRTTVYLLTALLLAIALFFWRQEPAPEEPYPLSVTVKYPAGEEILQCWDDGCGNLYVFLPSGIPLSQTFLKPTNRQNPMLDGQSIQADTACSAYQLNHPYTLSYSSRAGGVSQTLIFVQSDNMPSMFIDVRSGSMDYIHSEKGNGESGWFRLYTADGEKSSAGNLDSIRGRGNGSWMDSPKKPFSLKLKQPADLLGMGTANAWILLANANDPSHLRNKFVFDFAADAGLRYSPESQWVNLYLNGEYAGLYLLCERNEFHTERIDPDSGFLVSTDLDWRLEEKGDPFFKTENGITLRIQDTTVSETDIAGSMQSVENALLSPDGIDPVTGKAWYELIDTDSWAKKILIEEIFANPDGCSVSQFFYSNPENGKVYAGPVWDYDITLGNPCSWRTGAINALYACGYNFDYDYCSSWYRNLLQRDDFRGYLKEQYRDHFLPLLDEYTQSVLPAYAAQISSAAQMNLLRWPQTPMAEETGQMLDFLEERTSFLSSLWLEDVPYCTVLVKYRDDTNTGHYLVAPGDKIPVISQFEEMYGPQQWYTVDTEVLFDITQPVYADVSIYRELP